MKINAQLKNHRKYFMTNSQRVQSIELLGQMTVITKLLINFSEGPNLVKQASYYNKYGTKIA